MNNPIQMKFNHLSFPTKNVPEEAEFFKKYFGAEIRFIDPASGSALIKHGEMDIVLDAKSDVAWHPDFHFGFELETKREIEELYQKFTSLGIKVETEIFNRMGRGSRFFARTPGGIQFEINTREDAEAKFKSAK